MSKRRADKEKRNNPWEAFIFTLVFGLLILIAGGLNVYTIVIGSGVSIFSFFELPAIRLYFELRINKLTGTNVFQIQDSEISGSNVIANVKGDVIIQREQRRERPTEVRWPIEREFTLESEGYQEVAVKMKKGEKLEGEVKSSGAVNVYVMSRASLSSLEEGYDFNPYWTGEHITRTTIDFESKANKEVFLVVSDEYPEENDGQALQVELRLRTR